MPLLGRPSAVSGHLARQEPDCFTTVTILRTVVVRDPFTTVPSITSVSQPSVPTLPTGLPSSIDSSRTLASSPTFVQLPTHRLGILPPTASPFQPSVQPSKASPIPTVLSTTVVLLPSVVSRSTTSPDATKSSVAVFGNSGSSISRNRLMIIGFIIVGLFLCITTIFILLCYVRRKRRRARLVPQPFMGRLPTQFDVEDTDPPKLFRLSTSTYDSPTMNGTESDPRSPNETVVESELDSQEGTVLGQTEQKGDPRLWIPRRVPRRELRRETRTPYRLA